MKGLLYLLSPVFISAMLLSCSKQVTLPDPSAAQWIKVFTDSPVYMVGKIRADAEGNLYASYNHKDVATGSPGAILKTDASGTFVWRLEYPHRSVYDFHLLDESDKLLVVSANSNAITLTTVTTTTHDTAFIGAYPLPDPGIGINGIKNAKLLVTKSGNYNLSGTMLLDSKINSSAGFMMEINGPANQLLWSHAWYFSPFNAGGTSITGCTETTDGFMLIGNVQGTAPPLSQFFILCTDATGDTLFSKHYYTSSYDTAQNSFSGYYCETSDIAPMDDGNFFAPAFNLLYNNSNQLPYPIFTTDDNSARLFRISPSGDTLGSERLKQAKQNQVIDFVPKDNGWFLGLNPSTLDYFGGIGERYAFCTTLDDDLVPQNTTVINSYYTNYLSSVYPTPDGFFATLSMVQSLGTGHYYLQLIKTGENGSF